MFAWRESCCSPEITWFFGGEQGWICWWRMSKNKRGDGFGCVEDGQFGSSLFFISWERRFYGDRSFQGYEETT